jgi:hypothetical protein
MAGRSIHVEGRDLPGGEIEFTMKRLKSVD